VSTAAPEPPVGPPIEAVLFDLDDTLFLQEAWLAGAWRAVAEAAAGSGADGEAVHRALVAVAAEGSARGRIIDRALAATGWAHLDVAPLVEAFRNYRPARLAPLPGVREGLAALRGEVPIGVVTDGDPMIQAGKLLALGLADAFDVVVLSDELGRERRKPHPAPFQRALRTIGVAPERAVFVGDRPDKDVAGPMALGMRAVRVGTGEYAAVADVAGTWRSVGDAPAAIALLRRELAQQSAGASAPV
jgi:putative hydrolase of the HAD superfamily